MPSVRSIAPGLAALLLCALLALPQGAAAQPAGPLVLAAASLTEAMKAAADGWAARGHARPVLSFAASPALARQVVAGAPADLFVSADEDWMDYLAGKGLLRPGTRATFLTNQLVLVAPAGSPVKLALRRGPTGAAALERALDKGRLAMADPDAVPAGRYGRQALAWLGAWPRLSGRIARGESVRVALAFVRRGETPLGIVYATDARADRGVRVVAAFPAASHAPIRYPLALLKAARHREAAGFRRFLLSAEGRAIFRRFGFGAR